MAPFIQKQASIYPRDPISSPSENGVLEPEYYANAEEVMKGVTPSSFSDNTVDG